MKPRWPTGRRIFGGDTLSFVQPESEHSAATTCEGFALAGGRVTNFTSGQGLVLMKEVLYTISGKRLPVVFHIGARALTSHSLNVHCGHDDVMSVADCGWGALFGRNAQEACDLALIARRAAEACETPFMNVQDGFLTTHTIENIRLPEIEFMKEFVGDPNERLRCLFDPRNPIMTGVVQNQDSYMKGKIAQRLFYDKCQAAVQEAMDTYYAKTGRRYQMVDSYRMDDAEYALVGMGGMMETAQAAADYMRAGTRPQGRRRSRHVLRALPPPPNSSMPSRTSRPPPSSSAWTIPSRNRTRSCWASRPRSPMPSPASVTVPMASSSIRRFPACRKSTPVRPASARATCAAATSSTS
jgi:pyruvate/2-oxoacid:ferredoxin oxidoreductase alpha subunit